MKARMEDMESEIKKLKYRTNDINSKLGLLLDSSAYSNSIKSQVTNPNENNENNENKIY